MGIVDFKKIMIATDGSVCSKLAANKGIELARLSEGTVYAVYVVSTDYFSFPGMDFYWGELYKELKKEGEQAVNYIKEMGEMEGINVVPVLLEGNPSDKLIRYAEEEKMDIIIVGTLGKTGLDRLLLGSVAGNVVRYSKVPVMIVRDKCKL
jgi:nucleotide-binding universal stress UspA family protein